MISIDHQHLLLVLINVAVLTTTATATVPTTLTAVVDVDRTHVEESISGADYYTTATFEKLIHWVSKHRPAEGGVMISTGKRTIYPEVTGYFIPTLLQIGEHAMADEFGMALVSAQYDDGSFGLGGQGFVFDTAMVIRGLNDLVIRQPKRKEFVQTLNASCRWLTQEIDSATQRWVVPAGNIWGLPSGRGRVSEGIHLLGIVPLRKCGQILQNKEYVRVSEEMEKRLLRDLSLHELTDFTRRHHLSHFFAYIMEALQELGHSQIVEKGMMTVASYQQSDGSIAAYFDVEWVCTTGLAQLALVWYRMGDSESLARANRAMVYLFEQLQDKKTYGFKGSIGEKATYFPFQQISWAVKYALDALLAIPVAHFNHVVVDTFPTHIQPTDDRLIAIVDVVDHLLLDAAKNLTDVSTSSKSSRSGSGSGSWRLNVLDVGCGKGRFANALKRLYLNNLRVTGTDISQQMLRLAFKMSNSINNYVESTASSLPFPDNSFDLIYLVESMEHVLFVDATLRECHRVLRNNGVLLVIDKTTDDEHERSKLWNLEKWEHWYSIQGMTSKMIPLFGQEHVTSKRLSMDDGLFVAWQGKKMESMTLTAV